jgi:hypothetical protein
MTTIALAILISLFVVAFAIPLVGIRLVAQHGASG